MITYDLVVYDPGLMETVWRVRTSRHVPSFADGFLEKHRLEGDQ